MRHRKGFNHLSRKAPHRKAMLANMAASLIKKKRITTTTAKAKALRSYVEPLITKSKNDTTHSRRVVFSYLQDKDAVSELFREVSPKVMERAGGYTRILKLDQNRLGDNAEMAMIELVDFNLNLLTEKKEEKTTGTRRRRRGGKKKSTTEVTAENAAEAKEETASAQEDTAEVKAEAEEAKASEGTEAKTEEKADEAEAEEKTNEVKAEEKEAQEEKPAEEKAAAKAETGEEKKEEKPAEEEKKDENKEDKK